MNITADMLRDADACEDQVDIFTEEWPQGGEVTLASCIRAAEIGLDLDWAADELLTASAWAEYEKVMAPALAEYEKVRAPAWAEYEKVVAPALAEYEKVRAPAFFAAVVHDARHDGGLTDQST